MSNKTRFSALNQNPAQPKLPEERNLPEVRQAFTRQPVVNPSRVHTGQGSQQSVRTQSQANNGNIQGYNSNNNVQRNYNNNVQRNYNYGNAQSSYSYPQARSYNSAPHYNYSNIQRATSFHSAGWSHPSAPSGNFGGGGMRSFSGGGGMRSIGGGARSFGGGGAIRK